MPRTARSSVGGICYHVMNRGNEHATVFHDEHDYENFIDLMREACLRVAMRVLAWCLMPNHFHFSLWPREDRDLSRWMHWLMTTHVQQHRKRHGTCGHVWQGRFKAPPIQQDRHLLTVLRYIERNPLRANLVERAEDWRWSSLRCRFESPNGILTPSPICLGDDWVDLVNQPLTAAEQKAVRVSLRRGSPLGDAAWVRGTAERLGLLATLKPLGRPRSSVRPSPLDAKRRGE